MNFSVRMDADLKREVEAIYAELGMNLTSAVNAFLRQSVRVGGMPFDLRLNEQSVRLSWRCWKRSSWPLIQVLRPWMLKTLWRS